MGYATGERIERVESFSGGIHACQRFSLKLYFDRYVDNFRLDGLKKLNLHAMATDPSKMRERLGPIRRTCGSLPHTVEADHLVHWTWSS